MFAFKFLKPDAAARYHKKLTKDTAYREGENRRFALAAPAENMLRAAILESGWMMSNVTLRDINAQSGNAINIGASELHTGRTAGGRFRKRVAINGTEFWLSETDTCASISYGEMADIYNLGAAGDFDNAMEAFFARALALDMLRIGFNGTAIADTTDPEIHKKGEDVNIGWHALAKEYEKGKQIMADPLTLGDTGEWKNIDLLANHLITEMIAEPFREDPRLVVLVGAELAAQQRLKLFSAADRPADISAAQLAGSSVAGRFAFVPPFMPGKRLAVTTLSNLHIYTQANTRYFRAEFDEENAEYVRSCLRNEGYALGNPELYAAVDESAITLV
ncbi:major capsid protein [Cronobacter sakazakii]|uniref:P2 family phage major capsid protein n=1 Tax=Cronobacter sakazakii TaxID=28141 RepID=UPI000CF1C4BB|nr:P2 family phage major capsid protein [Cronobacter sakazakii]PPY25673.1 major capsid protein [Cronobacter sakazakii]PPY52889.1 major capsid protein [Cronobacter sakazakii]PQY73194.1 major capsid protein [Cronobacter sakazakii]PQY91336.1 major capsid protein [Cronobacter sakazakii]PQZ14901.1 major capsid protein [Cronobacter sakazakii]